MNFLNTWKTIQEHWNKRR